MKRVVEAGQTWLYELSRVDRDLYLVLRVEQDMYLEEEVATLLRLEDGEVFELYPTSRFKDKDLPWEMIA